MPSWGVGMDSDDLGRLQAIHTGAWALGTFLFGELDKKRTYIARTKQARADVEELVAACLPHDLAAHRKRIKLHCEGETRRVLFVFLEITQPSIEEVRRYYQTLRHRVFRRLPSASLDRRVAELALATHRLALGADRPRGRRSEGAADLWGLAFAFATQVKAVGLLEGPRFPEMNRLVDALLETIDALDATARLPKAESEAVTGLCHALAAAMPSKILPRLLLGGRSAMANFRVFDGSARSLGRQSAIARQVAST